MTEKRKKPLISRNALVIIIIAVVISIAVIFTLRVTTHGPM
ncbi:MAG: hypothetical protein ACNS63_10290 [Candidatus Nitrospinota bacterium M3_3B_026]